MRLIIVAMSLVLLSMSAWAGTFRDDFEDGNWQGWKVMTADTWNADVAERVSVIEGVLRIDAMNKPEHQLQLYIRDDWGDYRFSADVRIVDREPGLVPGGGVASRMVTSDSYGSYFIHGDARDWDAASYAKSKVEILAWQAELGGAVCQIGEWYRIEIDAIGNEISFYVDGELRLQRKDDSNPSGGVALYAYDAIVEFDNVVITGDDIPNIGPSGYAVEPEAKLAATWGWMKR